MYSNAEPKNMNEEPPKKSFFSKFSLPSLPNLGIKDKYNKYIENKINKKIELLKEENSKAEILLNELNGIINKDPTKYEHIPYKLYLENVIKENNSEIKKLQEKLNSYLNNSGGKKRTNKKKTTKKHRRKTNKK